MQATVAYDATNYISNSIQEVLSTLLDTLLIVMVVIFLFLGSFRSVLIPVVAIPISLVGAVFLMQVAGFTVNLLTLLAVVLSVGLVVDDAIVVVENVERHLSEGKSPLDAALLGARELVGPIVAMTITLAAVYLPIGLQGGLTGSLFREFAFTLAGAVAISGVVALTLTPVMSSRLLNASIEEHGLAGRIARDFKRLRTFYGRLLDATLAARPAVLLVWGGVSLLTVPLFLMSAKELAPVEDQGVIFGILDASANSTLDQNSRYAAAVNQAFLSTPETRVHLPGDLPPLGLQRHGREALGRAGAHHLPDPARGAAEAADDPGRADLPRDAAGAARRRQLPGGVHPGLHRRDARDPRVRPAAAGEGGGQRPVRLPAPHRREDRPAPDRVPHRPRQGGLPGPQPGADRQRSRRHGGRQLRQPLRHLGAQLQGHPPDPADRPPQSRPAAGRSTSPAPTAASSSWATWPPCASPWCPAPSTASSSSTP